MRPKQSTARHVVREVSFSSSSTGPTEDTRLLGGSESSRREPSWRGPSIFWLLGPYSLYTLAFGGIAVPKLNLIVDLVCKQYFADEHVTPVGPIIVGGDNPQCLEPAIQKKVAAFILVTNLVVGVLSTIAIPKLGHLSDRYGRKRLMAITSCGGLMNELVTILAAKFPAQVSYRWLILGATFDGLAGSFAAGNVLSQSYASDCTPPSKRAVSFGYLHACLFVGIALGPLLAGYFVEWTGSLVSILYVAFGCHVVFILSAAFVIPESVSKEKQLMAREAWEREKEARGVHPSSSWWSVVKASNPLLPLRILWLTGPGTSRRLRVNMVALAVSNTLVMGVAMAAGAMILLYSRLMFHWGNFEVSMVVSLTSFVRAFLLLIVYPVINYFGRTRPAARRARQGLAVEDKCTGADRLDIWVFRAALTADCLGCMGYIMARTPPAYVASALTTALGGLGSATIQSVITKHVPPERVGQILGAIGTLEALVRVVGPMSFNGLYALTVGTFPQAIFVLLFCLYGVGFICSFVVRPGVYWKGDGEHEVVEEDAGVDAGRALAAAEEQGILG